MSSDLQQEAPSPNSGGPEVCLSIVSGPHTGESRSFEQHTTLVVGRAKDAQWRLTRDPYFSRYQFRIDASPPQCLLQDLESSNGTLVNGTRATEVG